MAIKSRKSLRANEHGVAGRSEKSIASPGIKQPALSRIESQDDIQVSTLQRLVQHAQAANWRSSPICQAVTSAFGSSKNQHEILAQRQPVPCR